MSESRSLQELIVKEAGELFRKRGYAATTIKQIANAAGCTTAALYYHFEDGKQHILHEVIRRSAHEPEFSMYLPQADNLSEFLIKLGTNVAQGCPKVADRMNWIMLDFATLPREEKRIVQNRLLGNQRVLKQQISRYVSDEPSAERLAWLVYCSLLGYQQMFKRLELADMVDLSIDDLGGALTQIVEQSP